VGGARGGGAGGGPASEAVTVSGFFLFFTRPPPPPVFVYHRGRGWYRRGRDPSVGATMRDYNTVAKAKLARIE